MKYLVFLLFQLVGQNVFAQLPSSLSFTNYTKTQGLPEESILNTKEDSHGFIWIGSSEGLFRFDGKNFKTWYANKADANKFKYNAIIVIGELMPNKMIFLSSGTLWQIDILNFKLEPVASFAKESRILKVVLLANKQFAVLSSDSIFVLDNFFHRISSTSTLPISAKGILSVLPIESPDLLLCTGDNKYFLYNYKLNNYNEVKIITNHINVIPSNYIPGAYDTSNKRVYFWTFPSYLGYADFSIIKTVYQLTEIKNMPIINVRTMKQLTNNIWGISSDNGLTLLKDSLVENFKNQPNNSKSLTGQVVIDIDKTSDNTIWVSTNTGLGSFVLKPEIIKAWKTVQAPFNKQTLKAIIKAKDGNIYFIENNEGFFKLDLKNNALKKIKTGIGNFWGLLEIDDNIFLYGGSEKIESYNIKTQKVISQKKLLKDFYTPYNDLVTMMHYAKNGDIWYSFNQGGGLIREIANTKKRIHYSPLRNNPDIDLRYAIFHAEDSKGNLYFGSNKNHHLYRWILQTEKMEKVLVSELIPSYKHNTGITNLYIDKLDNVLISLDGEALLRYNFFTKQGNYYDMNSGLPTNNISSITSDSKNRIWIGTAKGLSCLLSNGEIVTFTAADGLPEDNINGDAMLYDSTTDKLYVCGETSIASFTPDSLLGKLQVFSPSVFIEDMLINGKPYYFKTSSKIKLSPNDNNISFTLASVDFARHNQIEYEYKINDGAWIPLGSKTNISFNNLPSGSYLLTARCKYIGTNNWKETEFPIAFIIATPWFKTWWFILLVTAAAVFLTWYIIRQYYLRKIDKQKAIVEKQNAVSNERNRIASDMHDDLGSGLTKINYLSQIAKFSANKDEEIEKIKNTSAALVENMSEIIWAMKEDNNSLTDLIIHIKNYAQTYCTENNLELILNLNLEYKERVVKGENRRHIYLAIKEALHNIVKHAKASNVYITTSYNSNNWEIKIQDDGIGFFANNKKTMGNGLLNLEKRLKAVGGFFCIENNNGTLVTLTIPV